ncbi:hypothetical protein ACFU8I_05355 [Streptomyces sp. NPDC057540]|uniref:hypothetical protein n=1 Tax=Streptomyces sp. NPDC057540 TaxID=3346160 RepID=UPI003688B0DD
MGVVEDLADPETNLLIFARTGQALDFSDEDLLTTRPARVESRSIASVAAYFDLLVGQVRDERGDRRLVRLRALVEVGKSTIRGPGAWRPALWR